MLRASRGARPPSRGQVLVEVALAWPLLVLVALGLVQFALYVHAESVVLGAVQDGAREAANSDRNVADGIADTRTILWAGLGRTALSIVVRGNDDGQDVTITATGGLPMILPGVAGLRLPLQARASVSKESFVVGSGG